MPPEPRHRAARRPSASTPPSQSKPVLTKTTTTTTTEPDRSARAWLVSQRTVVSAVLAVGLVGVAIPYGASTPVDPALASLTPLEWALSLLALISAATLIIEMARPLHPRAGSGYALALATGIWFTIAAYFVLLGPTIGWLYALSEGTRALAWAALALYEWRRVVLARSTLTGEAR